ncbi:MAG: DNA gyrase inhibitor YacG [Patescibacteria group bacterium]|jgi:endogenous inhibitor of DNA gyrase (YacG/DUF329 family)
MKTCPICKELFDEKQNNKYFPFDKEICRNLDLYAWLHEEYVVSEPAPQFQDEEE